MARKREVVKIDDKEYCFKELTVAEIIELVQDNDFFKAPLKSAGVDNTPEEKDSEPDSKEEKGDDLSQIISIFKKIGQASADFDIMEIQKLAPSEIRKLYEGFRKANADFFFILEQIGVMEMLSNLKNEVVLGFSKALAI